ncbi:RNase adapter RapZ [Pasteurella skyensis]|uniref:RNase adapter RapZ n=1 Tax=Phocoenobacter skyensis TaxID=97481 RepID=A0AAJ6NAA0_9PAST|nr:RNase adapter RapZ [Pasteurella skyensis]MDP8163038.1 RNase adapter RapZ [Pasteurella skyensis]MDP8173101.1 RNase adapter RapZ [Pasteurella skyensis]MDP8176324.1 RNase adapter RapZ [Pasteurella skyensis]MDP8178966.1 RNase adapter RapZ [Pasteurella skyensis]MDP8183735.1 RNase adapter RapZ [Pasteurella skyensis]
MELIIISGSSGSGKSVALRALEDMGYYCVDNIPLSLIPNLVNILSKTKRSIVVSLDVRNLPNYIEKLDEALAELPSYLDIRFIFLDCDPNVLVQRYSDSRRLHPLSTQDLSLDSAIRLETKILEPLYQYANDIIDTTFLSTHDLADKLRNLLRGEENRELYIIVESFGFKYGIPADADYVFDVRFLPNPHWDIDLRPMTGLEKPVIDFLSQHAIVNQFVEQTNQYLVSWLPFLEKNNRSYLTIAIGCTGGKHRSVFVAEQLYHYLKNKDYTVKIRHRQLENI